ncbi:glycine C-acetyltransferase [Kribbella capetownensis]|uniref:8-amino-7-oxononanoate synthase n=1 Tax=Kribbella capetownensis TaxID=1572659 RepID=A0A4V2M8E8_9ACTN|nr:glycine C-acetyltransferase [Kribbella capetownensis]TCC51252.1 glycine C-acetyltransferase [Kribbella capetownensis]
MVTLDGPQGPRIRTSDGRELLNLCSNDYLGLANDPDVRRVAHEALDRLGFGYASGRIISGTSTAHLHLEQELSTFFGTEASLLFTSCFDANTGLFEVLLGPDDVAISDAANHASIIDGLRLCRARRAIYPSRDLESLRRELVASSDAGRRLIVTDGVFSMDGVSPDLEAVCNLADEYDALVVVDDSHGTGVLGDHGRGTVCDPGVAGRVDLATGTFGKALGGAGGGFVSGRREFVDLLREKSRPYVFSNALPPLQVEVARYALRMLERDDDRRSRLLDNTALLRSELKRHGLVVPEGKHPIIPIILGDADIARATAAELLRRDILAVALTYPVVSADTARIRLQVSAAHTPAELLAAATTIAEVVRGMNACETFGVRT